MDANPTLALKLRDAALLVDVGLELEVGWLPPLVTQSRNAESSASRSSAAPAEMVFTRG